MIAIISPQNCVVYKYMYKLYAFDTKHAMGVANNAYLGMVQFVITIKLCDRMEYQFKGPLSVVTE